MDRSFVWGLDDDRVEASARARVDKHALITPKNTIQLFWVYEWEERALLVNQNKFEMAEHLHQRAVAVVSRFRNSEIELIEILELIDRHKSFYILKYSSLFEYATQGLGLSEAVAYIYIRVARVTRQVPALKDEIRGGHISVSKAHKIASVITSENQSRWLELAKSCSKNELEKQMALERPQEAICEKASLVSANNSLRVHLQLGVSEKLMLQLRRVQDVLSQKRSRPVSLEEVLEEIVPVYLSKEDPLEIAKRQKVRGKLVPGRVSETGASEGREPIPSATRHRVILKFGGRCGYIDAHGKRCVNRRFLDTHHIKKISEGGTNDFENLILLCKGHHKMIHAQE